MSISVRSCSGSCSSSISGSGIRGFRGIGKFVGAAAVAATFLFAGCDALSGVDEEEGTDDKPPTVYTLTTNAVPENSGGVIRDPDRAEFSPGAEVTLTAEPVFGYVFSGWEGVSGSPTALTTTVTMDRDRNVVANFRPVTSGDSIKVGDPENPEDSIVVVIPDSGDTENALYCDMAWGLDTAACEVVTPDQIFDFREENTPNVSMITFCQVYRKLYDNRESCENGAGGAFPENGKVPYCLWEATGCHRLNPHKYNEQPHGGTQVSDCVQWSVNKMVYSDDACTIEYPEYIEDIIVDSGDGKGGNDGMLYCDWDWGLQTGACEAFDPAATFIYEDEPQYSTTNSLACEYYGKEYQTLKECEDNVGKGYTGNVYYCKWAEAGCHRMVRPDVPDRAHPTYTDDRWSLLETCILWGSDEKVYSDENCTIPDEEYGVKPPPPPPEPETLYCDMDWGLQTGKCEVITSDDMFDYEDGFTPSVSMITYCDVYRKSYTNRESCESNAGKGFPENGKVPYCMWEATGCHRLNPNRDNEEPHGGTQLDTCLQHSANKMVYSDENCTVEYREYFEDYGNQ